MVILVGQNRAGNGLLWGIKENSLGLCIIIPVEITKTKDTVFCGNGSPFWRIHRERVVSLGEISAKRLGGFGSGDGNREDRDPHVLFVHRIGDADFILRAFNTFGNTPHILGAEVLPETAETHGRHFAVNQMHIGELKAVPGCGNAKGPPVGGLHGRIVEHGELAVISLLGPDLLSAHDQGGGNCDWRPGFAVVVAAGGTGMFPQADDGFVIDVIPAECLIALSVVFDLDDVALVAVFFSPLLGSQAIGQQLFAAGHKTVIRRFGVKGVQKQFPRPTGLPTGEDKIDRPQAAVRVKLPDHTTNTLMIPGNTPGLRRKTVETQQHHAVALGTIKADPLMDKGETGAVEHMGAAFIVVNGTGGDLVFREYHLEFVPVHAVIGGGQDALSGAGMFTHGIGKIVEQILTFPEGKVRAVLISTANAVIPLRVRPVCPSDLKTPRADNR